MRIKNYKSWLSFAVLCLVFLFGWVAASQAAVQFSCTQGERTEASLQIIADQVVIRSIEVLTEPDKIIYHQGDILDLTGLTVIINRSNATSEDVALADFAAQGISTSPANGTVLSAADTAVFITVNGKTACLAIAVGAKESAPVTVIGVSADKYWNGLNWTYNLYRFTVNGAYRTLQIKTEDGTLMGPKISKTTFITLGYYLAIYWEGSPALGNIIVIYVDDKEKYRGTPPAYLPLTALPNGVS